MKLSLRTANLAGMTYGILVAGIAGIFAGLLSGCSGEVAAQPEDRSYVVDRTSSFEGATGSLEIHCEPGDVVADVHVATTEGTDVYESVVVWPSGWRASARLALNGRGKIQLTLDCLRH